MLKKRIIPCLDIRDGRTVKGINFMDLRDAGDPVELAKRYVSEGADELVFLDIAATLENRNLLATLVEKIAKEINIPFTVGGGINKLADAREIIKAGADKVSINSTAFKNPSLITEIAGEFGNQCVVVAMDVKYQNNEWIVYVRGGTQSTNVKVIDWAQQAEALGAGELLLTSMNNDGTKTGFAIQLTDFISRAVHIPVIASGGAGTMKDFKDLFQQSRASAGLAASIFHFGEIHIAELKSYLQKENIPVR